MTVERGASWLDEVARERDNPGSIMVNKGSEFYGKAMEKRSYQNGVVLD